MGYTLTGGPKGLGQFNNTPQTVADLNKLVELIALVGNYRGGHSTAQRDALTGGVLYEGLLLFNTDVDRMEVYNGAGWVPTGPYAMATGSGTTNSSGNATVTFPAGRFSVAPKVSVTSTSARFATSAGITSTGFAVVQTNSTGAGQPGTFDWIAIQMTATAAAG